jgi:hypothetical protein
MKKKKSNLNDMADCGRQANKRKKKRPLTRGIRDVSGVMTRERALKILGRPVVSENTGNVKRNKGIPVRKGGTAREADDYRKSVLIRTTTDHVEFKGVEL